MKKMNMQEVSGISGGVDLAGLNAFQYSLSDKGTGFSNRLDNARMTQYRAEAEKKFGEDNFMEFLDQTGNKVYYVSLQDADAFMGRLS